jgi:hypothetical protein
LRDANKSETEVDTGKKDIAWLDDQAPARPDEASGCERGVLREGEL